MTNFFDNCEHASIFQQVYDECVSAGGLGGISSFAPERMRGIISLGGVYGTSDEKTS